MSSESEKDFLNQCWDLVRAKMSADLFAVQDDDITEMLAIS
jgi:hypothetical protein